MRFSRLGLLATYTLRIKPWVSSRSSSSPSPSFWASCSLGASCS